MYIASATPFPSLCFPSRILSSPPALGQHRNPPQVLEPSDVEEAVTAKGQVARVLVARRNEACRRVVGVLSLSPIHSVLGTCSFVFVPPSIRT